MISQVHIVSDGADLREHQLPGHAVRVRAGAPVARSEVTAEVSSQWRSEANSYRVLEGALIAARAIGAPEVVVALKASFEQERERVQRAIDELAAAGIDDISMRIAIGPASYLFGEESAMLEVVEGRQPFPRVTPPYRRGLDEGESDAGNSAATVGLAGAGGTADSPALVNNVETLANVPGIIVNGAAWFRRIGTAESPGSIVCTISGDTQYHGVGEFAMGTPLWDVIEELGGGPRPDQTLIAAVSGTANSALEASQFATALTYEDMSAAGSGLGSAGFVVLDDTTGGAVCRHSRRRVLTRSHSTWGEPPAICPYMTMLRGVQLVRSRT